jgi:hypothetical protein
MPRNALIQVRRDTAANWTSTNPTLAAGEIGFETDTNLFKIGNGSSVWSSLAYAAVNASNSVALSNKTITLGSNTVSGTTVQFNSALSDGDFATLAGSETLTNKTLTRPTLSIPVESWNLTGTAIGGATTVNVLTSSLHWYTSNATSNFSINFRGDGSTTLSSLLAVGQSVTVSVLVTNGASGYYLNGAVAIDGATQTISWLGGQAPSQAIAYSFDLYSFTIIKYGSTSYVTLGSLARFY